MSFIRSSISTKSSSKVVAQRKPATIDDDSDIESIEDSEQGDDDSALNISAFDDNSYNIDTYGAENNDIYGAESHSNESYSTQPTKSYNGSTTSNPSNPLNRSNRSRESENDSYTTQSYNSSIPSNLSKHSKSSENQSKSSGASKSSGQSKSSGSYKSAQPRSIKISNKNQSAKFTSRRESGGSDLSSNYDHNNQEEESGAITNRVSGRNRKMNQESGRSLATIDEHSDESGSQGEIRVVKEGIREEDGGSEDSSDDSSSGSESESSSDGSGSDSGSGSGSGSGSDSSSDTGDEEGKDETKFNDFDGGAILAQPMDVLNAIACALWDPTPDDESDKSSQVSSDSDSDSENEVLDGEGVDDSGTLSRPEEERAKIVFDHCANMDFKHLNEDQFGIALALLGVTENKEVLKLLYDELAISDGLDILGFKRALNKLRTKGSEEEFLERIQDAFDSLYEGTCMKDDQKDFTGQRYLIARELRLLLTTLGEATERLTDEEANEIIRECKPIYPKKTNPETGEEEDDGIAVAVLQGKIFFEQYRAMLLDDAP